MFESITSTFLDSITRNPLYVNKGNQVELEFIDVANGESTKRTPQKA